MTTETDFTKLVPPGHTYVFLADGGYLDLGVDAFAGIARAIDAHAGWVSFHGGNGPDDPKSTSVAVQVAQIRAVIRNPAP